MDPIRNILVIVDPTAKEHPAVVKGAALAEKFAARLDLFVCDTKASRNIRQAELARRPTQPQNVIDLESVLDGLAKPLRARGLDVTTESVSGDPLHAMLLDRVKRTCAELVIKDTHHHTVAERTILTHTDWELIRGCPTTLLLTKPKPWSSVLRVCAAVDPGHQDDKPRLLDGCILEQASELAQRTAGELHMAHVYVPTAFVAAAGSMPPMVIDVAPKPWTRSGARSSRTWLRWPPSTASLSPTFICGLAARATSCASSQRSSTWMSWRWVPSRAALSSVRSSEALLKTCWSGFPVTCGLSRRRISPSY